MKKYKIKNVQVVRHEDSADQRARRWAIRGYAILLILTPFLAALIALGVQWCWEKIDDHYTKKENEIAISVTEDSSTVENELYSVTVYVCNRCGVATEIEADKCSYCGEGILREFSFSGENPDDLPKKEDNYGFRQKIWKFENIQSEE